MHDAAKINYNQNILFNGFCQNNSNQNIFNQVSIFNQNYKTTNSFVAYYNDDFDDISLILNNNDAIYPDMVNMQNQDRTAIDRQNAVSFFTQSNLDNLDEYTQDDNIECNNLYPYELKDIQSDNYWEFDNTCKTDPSEINSEYVDDNYLQDGTDVNLDGKIGDFQQNKNEQDCWLLAGLETLSNTKEGAEIIKDSIHKNDDGTINVTFKGVHETYTFTPKEINDAETRLSTGDDDVRAIELGVEQYRKEGILNGSYKDISLDDPLNGGKLDETGFIFTGQKPEMVTENYDKYLDSIAQNPEKNGAEVGFKEYDFSNGIMPNHSYSIKSVDSKNVTVINPWDTSKEIVISREKFVSNIRDFAFYSP